MNIEEIKQRASDKAFAKIHFRKLDIDNYKEDIKTGLHGGITEAETKICLKVTKKELKVWTYIGQLIENDK